MTERAFPPAWYEDPVQEGRLRRWDGRSWTHDVRPVPAWLGTVRLGPGPTASPRRMARRFWAVSAALTALAFALLTLVRHGGGDDPDRLEENAFAREASTICDTARRGPLDDVPAARRDGRPEDPRRIEALVVGFEGMVADLRRIEVPVADRERVARWLGAWDDYISLGHRYAEALRAGDDRDELRANSDAQVPKQAVDRFSVVNGMNSCIF